jgi:uncharacterized membrane protein
VWLIITIVSSVSLVVFLGLSVFFPWEVPIFTEEYSAGPHGRTRQAPRKKRPPDYDDDELYFDDDEL